MPKIKPNPQLKHIVLEETNDGRDVVRFLKSTFMQVEDGVSLFGLRHKDYARSHKIAAARILARIGLEEGKRYLRRTYVRTPFRRIHPEDEDGPKRDMAASTAELYRLVKKETNDGRDIIIRFVGIMKGYHPEYKPHLRMAAAKELIRQIEFDYDDEPTRTEPTSHPVGASLVGAHNPQPSTSDESNLNPIPNSELVTEDSGPTPPTPSHTESASPSEHVGASLVGAHAGTSDESTTTDSQTTVHHQNHSSDSPVSLAQIQRQMHIEDGSAPYRDYAAQYAGESESIYQSIIRRAAYGYDLQDAQRLAQNLIGEFDLFMEERDPGYQPIPVPDQLIRKSLVERMDETKPWIFDPADYYDLDQDYFYYCMCGYCEQCDEVDYFFRFMRELQEETDPLYEDP